ncbi:MAG: DUF4007 family protein [Gammaproteobacteria bacterium]|nr:DUF4007 family protein [Gammaproteobacteria bacterium]
MRGPLFQEGYRPHLTGHQTFPLRYGWLKKVFDEVSATETQDENKSVFLHESAIARFGVGKNMVASMRHWASAAGIIVEARDSPHIRTTKLGRLLFGSRGFDLYMENPATLWLIHWHLAARTQKTTWFWAFNYFPAQTFEREQLIDGIQRIASLLNWTRVSSTTIRKDVACFIRTYVAQQPPKQSLSDGFLESPLTELGLVKANGPSNGFRFVRGPKMTLDDGVFAYALLDFWSRYSGNTATLSFEAIAHEPGGPGRVFLLDENHVADRLATLEDVTKGMLRWNETAGLKQVVRDPDLAFSMKLSFVSSGYRGSSEALKAA